MLPRQILLILNKTNMTLRTTIRMLELILILELLIWFVILSSLPFLYNSCNKILPPLQCNQSIQLRNNNYHHHYQSLVETRKQPQNLSISFLITWILGNSILAAIMNNVIPITVVASISPLLSQWLKETRVQQLIIPIIISLRVSRKEWIWSNSRIIAILIKKAIGKSLGTDVMVEDMSIYSFD